MAGRCLHAKLIASALFATCVQQSWALPPFAGIDTAIEAASDLCSADPSIAEEADLAMRLQALVQGPVLSCGNSEGAFVDATTALWESGYAPDEGTKPALVLQVSGATDVAAAVNFAQSANLSVAVKGGGLSVRNLWVAPDGLTIDLSMLRAVTVDPAAMEITAEGGCVYSDIIAATSPHMVAVPWGDADSTGMGLALGGGIGYLLRSHGLTADSIINATIVIANGTIVHASSRENADVLAAVRGGGSALGVVTSLAFKAYDVSSYTGGAIVLTDDDNCTNLRAAHEWAASATAQEPLLGVEILRTATLEEVILTVTVGMPGEIPEGTRQDLVAPLRMMDGVVQDELNSLDYYEHQLFVTNTTSSLEYGVTFVLGATFTFQQAEDGVLDLLAALLVDVPEGVTTNVVADYLGNTVADNAVKNTSSFTPFAGDVDMHYAISYGWSPGDNNTANAAFAEQQIDMLRPFVISTQPYINLATVVNSGSLEAQVGGAGNLAKLRSIKKQLDPTNFFKRHSFVGL